MFLLTSKLVNTALSFSLRSSAALDVGAADKQDASANAEVTLNSTTGTKLSSTTDTTQEAEIYVFQCFDIHPPRDWTNPSCELQLQNSTKCEERRNGTLRDGYCSRTCGACQQQLLSLHNPPTMEDLPDLRTWCEKRPYHIKYEKVALKRKDKNEPIGEASVAMYHMHTPKVAGVSFIEDLKPLLPPGSMLNTHEGCYSDITDATLGTVMMVREPRRHVYSQYHFCATSTDLGPTHMHDLMPKSFESWVNTWSLLKARGRHLGNFTIGPQSAYNDPWCFSTLPFGCYNPVNLQSHRLTCSRVYDYEAQADLRLVLRNMEEAFFVGVVEAYQESICLLNYKLKGVLPEWCNCTNSTAWEAAPIHQEDHGSGAVKNSHGGVQDLAKEVLAQVDDLTMTDKVLYDGALERFVKDVHHVEMKMRTKILCKKLTPVA